MIVAVTGVILILFVIGHLLGNLQIFLGPDWINGYAEHLHDLGPLLWIIRAILLIVVLLHIYYTIRLAIENRARASAELSAQRYREGDVCLAPYGHERHDPSRLYRLPPAPIYLPHD